MLAAGLGERLRPHTLKLAKPAIPFLNIPLMGFPLFYLEADGLTHLVVNTHHLPQTVEAAVKMLCGGRFTLDFSPEDRQILGSGGGLAQALGYFDLDTAGDDPIVVANADALCLFSQANPVEVLCDTLKKENALAALLLSRFPEGSEAFGGVYLDNTLSVRRFSKTTIDDPALFARHFTGYMAFNPFLLDHLKATPSNLLYDIIQPLIDKGEKVIGVVDRDARFFESGNQSDYLSATKSCLEALNTPKSVPGETLRAILNRFTPGWDNYKLGGCHSHSKLPDKFKTSAMALIGRGVSFDGSVNLDEFAVIGDNVRMNKGSAIVRSVLGSNVTVADHELVQDQILL